MACASHGRKSVILWQDENGDFYQAMGPHPQKHLGSHSQSRYESWLTEIVGLRRFFVGVIEIPTAWV